MAIVSNDDYINQVSGVAAKSIRRLDFLTSLSLHARVMILSGAQYCSSWDVQDDAFSLPWHSCTVSFILSLTHAANGSFCDTLGSHNFDVRPLLAFLPLLIHV